MTRPDFRKFPKISRLTSPVVVSEKVDGTNGLIYVDYEGGVFAGSRNRWLTEADGSVADDNYGFGAWVRMHARDLRGTLGPGYHYGEWFGKGIARNYGLDHRRFYLFAVDRYPSLVNNDLTLHDGTHLGTVPVLHRAVEFDHRHIPEIAAELHHSRINSFPRPEGFCIFFEHNHMILKVVLDKHNEKKVRPAQGPGKPKVQWTPEMIEEARKASAERKAAKVLVDA